jgi:hypothetical protein
LITEGGAREVDATHVPRIRRGRSEEEIAVKIRRRETVRAG